MSAVQCKVSAAIGMRQPEPPEGRKMFPVVPNNTAGVMNFDSDTEYDFSTANMGFKEPSAILSMWVDASGFASADNVIITMPQQTLVIAGGTQGYYIVTSQNPFTMKVTASANPVSPGIVNIVLYNYNVLATGLGDNVPVGAPANTSSQVGNTFPHSTPREH